MDLRLTFESQSHLGPVVERPISEQSEIQFGFADCPRPTVASAGWLQLSMLVQIRRALLFGAMELHIII